MWKPKYDWSLHHGYGEGLKLTFMPGLHDRDHYIEEAGRRMKAARGGKLEAVNVSDDLYDLVEPCIGRHWPGYNSGYRTGLIAINADQWRDIAQDMKRQSTRLRLVSASQIRLYKLHQWYVDRVPRLRVLQRHLAARIEIADALDELRETLDRWARTWPVIHLHGY
jgi:hypothetical protein